MNSWLPLLHWVFTYWETLLLALVALVALASAVCLLWRPYWNRRRFVDGYNSIADQFMHSKDTTISLTAPAPPAAWSVVHQTLFRNGQLKALSVLEAHNQRVEAALKRGRKRATARKKRV